MKRVPANKTSLLEENCFTVRSSWVLMPFSVHGKILMQEMWTSVANWNDKLVEVLEGKAYKWLEELPSSPSVTVPTCLKLSEEEVVSSALHVFVDASPAAYGATAYARYIYQSGSISRRIIASKAKVAPLKAVSLPCLEMMGAIVRLRLASSISSVLESLIKQATFWSDSMDVLWLIMDNVGDMVKRGMSLMELAKCNF